MDHNNDAVFDFQRLKVMASLGRGAKGVVFLVKDQETEDLMALKVISRDLIHRKSKSHGGGADDYRRVLFEQQVLRRLDHPLLPKLYGVLDTESLVGFAIDYCPGGDLNSLRKKQTEKMFSDDVIRFYAAELVMALEYLHSLGIVYRDLKPENVMIQWNGHIMLVDFDLSTSLSTAPAPIKTPQPAPKPSAKKPKHKKRRSLFHSFCNSEISPDDLTSPPESETKSKPEYKTDSDYSSGRSNSFVGTEEYVAPEIISGAGHGFEVDWWSLGVLLQEMLYGATPFRGINRKETFYRILAKSPELMGEATPLRDLIRKLLEKDPKQRIGVEEIKGHEFFKGIGGRWETVAELARPPHIPEEREEEGKDENKKIDVESVVEVIFGEKEKLNNATQPHAFSVF